jgi:hypothetical protein
MRQSREVNGALQGRPGLTTQVGRNVQTRVDAATSAFVWDYDRLEALVDTSELLPVVFEEDL